MKTTLYVSAFANTKVANFDASEDAKPQAEALLNNQSVLHATFSESGHELFALTIPKKSNEDAGDDKEEQVDGNGGESENPPSLVEEIKAGMSGINWEAKPDQDGQVDETAKTWDYAAECYKCQAQFTWGYLGLRSAVNRHHCRKCGKSVCDSHGGSFCVLVKDEAPQRVCVDCAEKLPPQSTDIQKEVVYAKTMIAETKKIQEYAQRAIHAISCDRNLLGTHASTVNATHSDAGATLALLKTRIPNMKSAYEIELNLAQSDSPKNDSEQSFIVKTYSSPRLKSHAERLVGFASEIEQALKKVQEIEAEFESTEKDVTDLNTQFREAVDTLQTTDCSKWKKICEEAINTQTLALASLESLKISADTTETESKERTNAVSKIANSVTDIRLLIRTIVDHLAVTREKLAQCGAVSETFTNGLSSHQQRCSDGLTNVLNIEKRIQQWHMQRECLVESYNSNKIKVFGNLNESHNRTILQLKESLAKEQKAIDSLKSQLKEARAQIKIGPQTDKQNLHLIEKLREEIATLKQENTPSKNEAKLHKKIENLTLELQMINSQLQTERKTNQKQMRDFKELLKIERQNREQKVADAQKIALHRDNLQRDNELLAQQKHDLHKKGYDAEVTLLKAHEALVSIYRLVHPDGGRDSKKLFEIRPDSALAQETLTLVEDHAAAASQLKIRCLHLEAELEEYATTPAVESVDGQEKSASPVPVDKEKYAKEIQQLRVVGFDFSYRKYCEVLDQVNGDLNEAVAILLDMADASS